MSPLSNISEHCCFSTFNDMDYIFQVESGSTGLFLALNWVLIQKYRRGKYNSGISPKKREYFYNISKFLNILQEPITRSVQLSYFRATAFSQVGLFLDMPFLLKLLFRITFASKSEFIKMTAKLGCFCYGIPFSTCRFPTFQSIIT